MLNRLNWWWIALVSVVLGASAGAITAFFTTPKVFAQQNSQNSPNVCTQNPQQTASQSCSKNTQQAFPDVPENYWAKPFIQALAQEGIIAGYPDGKYRPEKPVERDELAAMIRQAFNEERVRNIPSGSVFKDVPANYWAAPPIEEAYETGFMQGYPDNLFKPRQPVPKVQALVSLTNGLDLDYQPSAVATNPNERPVNVQAQGKKPRNVWAFPLATTALMAPVLQMAPAVANEPVKSTPATTNQAETANKVSALDVVQNHYTDAEKIPDYAVNNVAAATESQLVVNYPNSEVLNPNQLLERGAAAAIIYQALVWQGKVAPLAENSQASNYVVNATAPTSQRAQTPNNN